MSAKNLNTAVDALFSTNIGNSDFSTTNTKQTLRTRYCQYAKTAADAMASTTTTISFFRAPVAVTITNVYIIPNNSLTADNTNYATVSIKKADGAGGSKTSCASITTKITDSNDWAADTTLTMTLDTTYANRQLAAGNVMILDIAKAASGVAVPICEIVVEYTED